MSAAVPTPSRPQAHRRAIIGDAAAIGIATGAYGISFGAIAVTAGLSIAKACALSLLMFTGASQFAFVTVLGGGGGAAAAITTALLLGSRNGLYGLRLAPLLQLRGVRRVVGAQLVIDESTALAVAQDDQRSTRLGFWSAGIAVYVCWNAGTAIGAFGASAIAAPEVLGLDAAVAAAFVALLAPRLRATGAWPVALTAAGVALALIPSASPGVAVLCAGAVAVAAGMRPQREVAKP